MRQHQGMELQRAVVGSTNPAKVEAVRSVLARLAPACVVTARDVQSEAGAQPIGDEATRAGALARARAALVAAPEAEIAFGLEGGVIPDGPRVWLCSWVVALDRGGRSGAASGLRMELPPRLAAGLRAGRELGDLIDELFGVTDSKRHLGAIGILTSGEVSRTAAFAHLVAMSLAPFLHPDVYGKADGP